MQVTEPNLNRKSARWLRKTAYGKFITCFSAELNQELLLEAASPANIITNADIRKGRTVESMNLELEMV